MNIQKIVNRAIEDINSMSTDELREKYIKCGYTIRYFTYSEPRDDGSENIVTLSEEEILKVYKPYFMEQMKKVTREIPEITDELILDNWKVINWAWETNIDGSILKQT